MAVLNPREEIVMLLRGYFTCSIINALGKRGVLERMIPMTFTEDTFSDIADKDLFRAVLDYFVKLNLLDVNRKKSVPEYVSTELGKKVFKRYGSFTLLHSYGPFLNRVEPLLFDFKKQEKPKCDRLENVIGSGQTNGRKYFPLAIEMIKGINPGLVADIGCGDGNFLSKIMSEFPNVDVIASDISKISVDTTLANLEKQFPTRKTHSIISDASDVQNWAGYISNAAKNIQGKTVISMWYLVHEISHKKEAVVIDFFESIHRISPQAEIIVGEIVNLPEDMLRNNRYSSIMPEFLFFHEISGQGILTWEQCQSILKKIPYKLTDESWFDKIEVEGKVMPTGFIWHLSPKGGK